jgi:hypothetical protein
VPPETLWRSDAVQASLEAKPLEEQYGRRLVYGDDERVGRWIAERTDGEYRPGAKCIGLERRGELIAGCMVDWFNGASCYMHIAAEGRHWLNRDFLWHCFHYVFHQIGARVAIGLVPSNNAAALRFDKHLGFTELARIPGGHPDGDLVVLTITKEQAMPWLSLKEAA